MEDGVGELALLGKSGLLWLTQPQSFIIIIMLILIRQPRGLSAFAHSIIIIHFRRNNLEVLYGRYVVITDLPRIELWLFSSLRRISLL